MGAKSRFIASTEHLSSTVIRMVTEGHLLRIEEVLPDRPQVLFDIMKDTFKNKDLRPTFEGTLTSIFLHFPGARSFTSMLLLKMW